jgi:hypothetical protein
MVTADDVVPVILNPKVAVVCQQIVVVGSEWASEIETVDDLVDGCSSTPISTTTHCMRSCGGCVKEQAWEDR